VPGLRRVVGWGELLGMSDILRVSHKMAELAMIEAARKEPLKRYKKVAQVFAIQLESDIEVETREGWLKARKGDYLVVNVSPGISYPWPVKKEIFESTYEIVK
jgi:hypothetical protein